MSDKINKSDEEWRQELSSEQYKVCRKKGTERAFTGEYYDCKEKGVYLCSCCGNELFDSATKYDSGTGWPSFTAPIDPNKVGTDTDNSLGMARVEVVCSHCNAHLGHVFDDGPGPDQKRYCINSVSLSLDKK